MKTQKILQDGEIIQITEPGPIWTWTKHVLVGRIVKVIDTSDCPQDKKGFTIRKVHFLQEGEGFPIGDVYLQFKYKRLPKYATKHFKMKKEEENQDGS